MTTIKPIRDFVAIKKEEENKKTAGGLFIPGNAAQENVITGEVVAIGSGKITADGKVIPMELAIGNKVVFDKGFAAEVKLNGDSFYLLKEEVIFCSLPQ